MKINTKKFAYYNSLIQKIQNTRKRNNKNWMDIIEIGFKYKPGKPKLLKKFSRRSKTKQAYKEASKISIIKSNFDEIIIHLQL